MNAENSLKNKIAAVLALLSLIAMVTVNALANILPLNGVQTGKLSDEIPNLFVPAGITFAIWGLIYLLLIGYVVIVLIEAFGKKPSGAWKADEGFIFTVNALLNSAWIFAWHWRQVFLSLIIMVFILLTLIILMEKLYARREKPAAGIRAFLLRTPILVYLGWICVATIANVTALLVKVGWNGFGLPDVFWTVLVIFAGLLIGILLLFRRQAYSSALVIVWAYAGIVIKRFPDGIANLVLVAAFASAMSLFILVLIRFILAKTGRIKN